MSQRSESHLELPRHRAATNLSARSARALGIDIVGKPWGFAKDAAALSGLLLLAREPDAEDVIRRQAKSLSAQATVAVFVGAIQTQGLTFSIDKNETHLQLATNIFFFVGILLNVVGAYYALMSSSSLEADIYELKSILRGMSEEELDHATQVHLSPLAGSIIRHRHSVLTGRWNMPPTQNSGSPSQSRSRMFDNIPLERLCHSISRNRNAGKLGIGAIFLGFISCPAAFLCLVQDTQPAAVKIVTLTIVGILFSLRILIQYFPRRRV